MSARETFREPLRTGGSRDLTASRVDELLVELLAEYDTMKRERDEAVGARDGARAAADEARADERRNVLGEVDALIVYGDERATCYALMSYLDKHSPRTKAERRLRSSAARADALAEVKRLREPVVILLGPGDDATCSGCGALHEIDRTEECGWRYCPHCGRPISEWRGYELEEAPDGK